MATQWYYSQAGKQLGPVTLDQLQGLAGSGQLRASDLVWNEKMSNWTAAGQVGELATLTATAPVAAHPSTARPQAASPAQPARAGAVPVSAATAAAGSISYEGLSMDAAALSERGMTALRQTKPWARFIAILMFILGGFVAIVGLIFMIGMMPGPRGMQGVGAVMGLIYIAMAMLYIAPAIFLNRYASRLGSLMNTRRNQDLDAALEAQKSFWKFVGITAAIVIGIYLVILLVAVIGGIAASQM